MAQVVEKATKAKLVKKTEGGKKPAVKKSTAVKPVVKKKVVEKTPAFDLAVVESGGKQYVVRPDEIFDIEKIDGEKKITFDKVLLVKKGSDVKIGTPYLDGEKIEAEITEHHKGKKIIVFKYKNKTRYKRKQGHRQQLTRVKID